MREFFAWMFVVFAACHLFSVYRHMTGHVLPSRWNGASAAGQACLACGSLGLGALCAMPKGSGSPVAWAMVVIAVAAMFLGRRIESAAMPEVYPPQSTLKRAAMRAASSPLRFWC